MLSPEFASKICLGKAFEIAWRLFDLKADPKETRNLAKAHADVAAGMRKRYDAWTAKLPGPDTSWKKDGRGGRMPQGWGWATDAESEEWKGQKGNRA